MDALIDAIAGKHTHLSISPKVTEDHPFVPSTICFPLAGIEKDAFFAVQGNCGGSFPALAANYCLDWSMSFEQKCKF